MRAAQGVIRTPRVPNSDCLSRSPSQCFLYPRFKLDGTWAASARAAQVCRQQEQQHLIARTPRLHSTRFQQISLPVESIFSDAPPTLPSPSKQLVDNIDDDPFLFYSSTHFHPVPGRIQVRREWCGNAHLIIAQFWPMSKEERRRSKKSVDISCFRFIASLIVVLAGFTSPCLKVEASFWFNYLLFFIVLYENVKEKTTYRQMEYMTVEQP